MHSLHVPVVATAVDAGASGDTAAINQQANIIAQHFQSSGVNEVVAVGEGSLVWPDALQANQSSLPPALHRHEREHDGDDGARRIHLPDVPAAAC